MAQSHEAGSKERGKQVREMTEKREGEKKEKKNRRILRQMEEGAKEGERKVKEIGLQGKI